MGKKIYRSRKDKVMGGVIAGLVDYFDWNIDPNMIRVLVVILALAYGSGLLLYIIAWIVIPLEPMI